MKPTVVALLTCLAVGAPAMAQNYGVTVKTGLSGFPNAILGPFGVFRE